MEIPRSIRILLCDDDQSSLDSLNAFLVNLGFTEIHQVTSTKDAKLVLQQGISSGRPIDLIISDWIMPVESGTEFVRWIRNHESFRLLPFIMVTAQSSPNEIIEGISKGISAYILKPANEKILLQKLTATRKKHHP